MLTAPLNSQALRGLREKEVRISFPVSQLPPNEGGHCSYCVSVYLYISFSIRHSRYRFRRSNRSMERLRSGRHKISLRIALLR